MAKTPRLNYADASNPGLLSAGAQVIPGVKTFPSGAVITGGTTGAPVAAGKVGELLEATAAVPSVQAALQNITNLTLNKGVYLLYSSLTINLSNGTFGSDAYMSLSISLTSGTEEQPTCYISYVGMNGSSRVITAMKYLVVSADSTTVYLVSRNGLTSVGTASYTQTGSINTFLKAIRIA